MFERATTFWRATSVEDEPASRSAAAAGGDLREGLTRAQARALSRCEPLTPAEFKARRRAADQGLASLSGILGEGADAPRR
jgi:hypothetical protein